MKRRLFVSFIALILLYGLAYIFGIDKVDNQIQLLSAIPWFYMLYRIEELHMKHDRKEANNNASKM